MKSSAKKIQIASFDSLFSQEDRMEAGNGTIQELALADLFPFPHHPFRVFEDEAMQNLVESIRTHGVLVPGIARPRVEGGYELIAGHRRKYASELAGKTTMPVIIRELDNEDATLYMVDSNLQRENLLPSEKAWAYKMKLDAIRRKAGRPAKNNSGQLGQNFKGKVSAEIVAEHTGESYKQIQRYIRLTELHPALLQMVDNKKLPFNSAVELSYLTQEEQRKLFEWMGKLEMIPSLEQAKRLKKYSQERKLCVEVMDAILTEKRSVPVQVILKKDRLQQYFPQSYTQKQMEEVIFTLLETWKTEQK